MAVAAAYDEWADVGSAHGEDEVVGYVMASGPEERVRALIDYGLTITRKTELPGCEKAVWWTQSRNYLPGVISWYCRVAELPGIDRATVWDLPTNEGEVQILTAAALRLDAGLWVQEWRTDVTRALTRHVTLCRAKFLLKMSKQERSLSNRISNAFIKELDTVKLIETRLASLTR
jgi:hypothetical protein